MLLMKVVPGDVIGKYESNISLGVGTYESNGIIYASMLGEVKDCMKGENRFISVETRHQMAHMVLAIGDVVLARILRINIQQIQVEILANDKHLLRFPTRAILRQEDIRESQTDLIVMNELFHPGDIIVAKVVSLGDARYFFISTAGPDLGVVSPNKYSDLFNDLNRN